VGSKIARITYNSIMAFEENYVLSVVVPVGQLNGEISALQSWISIVNNIQVIIVLDHIDDKTREAINLAFAITNHPGIQIFEVDFRNPGDSRNFGLSKATGSWILFADADDVPQISSIEEAIHSTKDTADIIVGNFETLAVKTGKKTKHEAENLQDLIKRLPKNLGLWRFVFRHQYLRESGVQFPPLCMAEDQVFYLELNPRETQFEFANLVFYSYHIGNNFQLTNDPEKIQDLRIAINLSLQKISQRQTFRNLDFLAAQIFALLGNSSRRHLIGNFLFLLGISPKIISLFGLGKLISISTYPVGRLR